MNDEQLTRLFRSLEEQAEPDQAFNESLFARLEREAHGGGFRRSTSARWVLLAAALLVAAAVGAAAAVGSGLIKLPFELAVASPTPQPSASTVASATPIPSATASASATPLPTASIPQPASIQKLIATHDGFLAIGSAPTSGDDVNVLLRAPSDASGWEAIDDPGFGRIFDAAAGSSSEIIVTNTKQDLSGTFNVWRSTDGQTWTLDTGWTTDATTAPVLATGGPAGFLILGQTGPKLGRLDLVRWQDVGTWRSRPRDRGRGRGEWRVPSLLRGGPEDLRLGQWDGMAGGRIASQRVRKPDHQPHLRHRTERGGPDLPGG